MEGNIWTESEAWVFAKQKRNDDDIGDSGGVGGVVNSMCKDTGGL